LQGESRVVLGPGAALFLPRGVWHRTEAIRFSVSLDFAVDPPTRGDYLIGKIRAGLMQYPEFRRSMDSSWESWVGSRGDSCATIVHDVVSAIVAECRLQALRNSTIPLVDGGKLVLDYGDGEFPLTVAFFTHDRLMHRAKLSSKSATEFVRWLQPMAGRVTSEQAFGAITNDQLSVIDHASSNT
jgi:hypothetical protein